MTMNKRISEILEEYRNVAKPLMEDIYQRIGFYPVNCLNEIRALNDHIARCHREGIEKTQIDVELDKASGHVQRLVYDCLKQLNITLFEEIERVEKNTYSYQWLYIAEGTFWQDFTHHKRMAMLAAIDAKKQESFNPQVAVNKYQEAYNHYIQIENLIEKYSDEIKKSGRLRKIDCFLSGWKWFVTSVITAGCVAVLRFIIDKFC